jgi:hypothetical protein
MLHENQPLPHGRTPDDLEAAPKSAVSFAEQLVHDEIYWQIAPARIVPSQEDVADLETVLSFSHQFPKSARGMGLPRHLGTIVAAFCAGIPKAEFRNRISARLRLCA